MEITNYKNYYEMRSKLLKYLEWDLRKWNGIKAKILIAKALFSRGTTIIPTELDREDYGCDVGYIVSINIKK